MKVETHQQTSFRPIRLIIDIETQGELEVIKNALSSNQLRVGTEFIKEIVDVLKTY